MTLPTMFLVLTNIKGESLAQGYEDKIEVHDWDWGMHNNASFNLTGEKVAQQTRFKHLTIHKKFDASTPTLMQYCTQGTKIPDGLLVCRKYSGEDPVDYLKIELKDIKVNRLDWPVKGVDDGGFAEVLDLSFHHVKVEYSVQQDNGSLAKGAVIYNWHNISSPNDNE